jgi:hypothetical protein
MANSFEGGHRVVGRTVHACTEQLKRAAVTTLLSMVEILLGAAVNWNVMAACLCGCYRPPVARISTLRTAVVNFYAGWAAKTITLRQTDGYLQA